MLLSVCIPTYNRPEKVKNLLNFLSNELSNSNYYKVKIEFIVGDNSSNIFTQDICFRSDLYKNNSIKYIKNKTNLGLVGNVLSLCNRASGEYVWIMGDDDFYHKNILSVVQKTILEDNYSFIFLNHRAYSEDKQIKNGFNSAVDLKKQTIYEDGKKMLFDIWNCSNTSMMFLSACIYKREDLQNCLKSKMKINLAYPMFMSFYCAAQGKSKIVCQIYIDNIWGATSWSKSAMDVFYYQVPRVLYFLPKIGYNYGMSRKIFIRYIRPRISAILITTIKNIFK